jgi:hypothetical protein
MNIAWIMHDQLWVYKVKKKLHLGIREKRLTTTGLINASWQKQVEIICFGNLNLYSCNGPWNFLEGAMYKEGNKAVPVIRRWGP